MSAQSSCPHDECDEEGTCYECGKFHARAAPAKRAPMTRAKHPEPDMHLPVGKTCADCRHFARCSSIYGHILLDEVCDWAPSRFAPRAVSPAPDWTAEEEEQFRTLERQQSAGEVPC